MGRPEKVAQAVSWAMRRARKERSGSGSAARAHGAEGSGSASAAGRSGAPPWDGRNPK